MRPRPVVLTEVGSLPDPRPGFRLAARQVGINGEGLFLYVPESRWDNITALTRPPAKPMPAEIVVVAWGAERRIELSEFDAPLPSFDLLPNGGVTVASARNRRNTDPNASVYGPDGKREYQFCVGDAVEDIQADSTGRIWVSHFDEAFDSRYSGLVCHDLQGRVLLDDSAGRFLDVYALNVTHAAAWAYAYTAFDLCRFGNDLNDTSIATPMRGCHAFAESRGEYVFHRQYGEPAGTAHYLSTGSQGLVIEETFRLVLPDGAELADPVVLGRGSALHIFEGSSWYRFDVTDARA